MTDEDKIWLKKLAENDMKAYRSLFDKYYYILHSFAFKYLEDKTEAEDVVQDVFYDLWKKRELFSSVDNFKAYIYTAVKNACIAVFKHRKAKLRFDSEYLLKENSEFFFTNIIEEEVYIRLRSEVNQLPMQTKIIYELVLAGYSNEEIVSKTGLSMDAVKSQKKRGKSLLKDRMQDLNWMLIFIFYSCKKT